MAFTIEQIKKIIKAKKDITNKTQSTIKEVIEECCKAVCKQTHIGKIENVIKLLDFLDSYKENDWVKEGIEKVLLEGTFPYSVIYKEPYKEKRYEELPNIGSPITIDFERIERRWDLNKPMCSSETNDVSALQIAEHYEK